MVRKSWSPYPPPLNFIKHFLDSSLKWLTQIKGGGNGVYHFDVTNKKFVDSGRLITQK